MEINPFISDQSLQPSIVFVSRKHGPKGRLSDTSLRDVSRREVTLHQHPQMGGTKRLRILTVLLLRLHTRTGRPQTPYTDYRIPVERPSPIGFRPPVNPQNPFYVFWSLRAFPVRVRIRSHHPFWKRELSRPSCRT